MTAAPPPPTDEDSIPRQPLWRLVPRRNLVKVAVLLLVLAGVILFQRRSERMAREMAGLIGVVAGDPAATSRGKKTAPELEEPAPPPAAQPTNPRTP